MTGGSGKLGGAVVRELAGHGHEVVSVDQRPPAEPLPARFRQADLGDVGQVAGAMLGCDVVIHLGAIPQPYGHPDEVVFGNNTRATYSVLQAAMLLGVRRAVVASSLSALGGAWGIPPFPPLYAPVDEAHPLTPKDPYGLSKEVDERTCEMFHRRTGMAVLAYRFHSILTHEEAVQAAGRVAEHPADDAHLLWGYVDLRDAATACRLGAEAGDLGFEVFNVTAADTLSEAPTEEMIRMYCPAVEIRGRIEGTASAWSVEKARRLLGYEPKHSWRDPS